MIGRLTGRVVDCTPGDLLLDVAGVGYALRIPLSTFYALSGGSDDLTATLHVHTYVRQDSLQLYGFSTLEERRLFEILISLSKVGPTMALAILSGIGAAELRETVGRQDRTRLQKIPGVGRKTAERLLLELRDRLKDDGSAAGGRANGPSVEGDGGVADAPWRDAVSALVNLGYSRDRAGDAVDAARQAAGPDAGLEAVLRRALGRLAG